MAKLICSDGTEVKISEETEAELRKQFGKKERHKFKKIYLCHLRIDVPCYGGRIALGWKDSEDECFETPESIRDTIEALQSAIDYIENK